MYLEKCISFFRSFLIIWGLRKLGIKKTEFVKSLVIENLKKIKLGRNAGRG